MKKMGIRAAAWAAAIMLGSGAAAAQEPTGTIRGRVTIEATGEPVHGATVVVLGARRTVRTGEDGRYEVDRVAPGTYEVLAYREHLAAPRQAVVVAANQAATLDFALSAETRHEHVTVTASPVGAATTFQSFNAVTSLDIVELAKNRGATISDALEGQPGVATRSFGAGSSRPVIRGFDGDRVLVMQDGIRTGDLSSQSGDHGVTIDPGSLDRLEVVRGPATLLYGSNAVGGVVNAISPQEAFRTSPFTGVLGGVSADAGSANGQGGVNGNVQYGRDRWILWFGGGSRRTGDYDTPAGPVENSATRMANGRAGAGYVGDRLFVSVAAQAEGSRFGIPFAGEFHAHDEGGDGDTDIVLDASRREARIDAGLRNLQGRFLDHVRLTASFTAYGHDEIEIEDGRESVGTEFSNDTTSVRLEFAQKRSGRLGGRLGVEWFGRDYRATGGEVLAPPTLHGAFSAFAYEELDFGRARLQFGGRLERTSYEVGDRPASAEADEHGHEPPPVRDRAFTAASGSFGVHADLGEHAAVVANLTSAARAPALEELYNFGPHVGNLAFEIGNPDLALERTIGLDLSLRSRGPAARTEVSFFVYGIRNFVFLDFTGDVVDGLREAEMVQADSRFVGVEASAEVEVHPLLHLSAALSYVRATLSGSGEPLPRIPALGGRVEAEVPWKQVTITPEVVFTADQGRVFRDETPTGGSTVFNLGATWVAGGSHVTHSIAVKAYNLTNTEYRRHTSFIKDLAPEMGRGVRVTYALKFF